MRTLWKTVLIALVLSILSAQVADLWLSDRISLIGSFAGLEYYLNPGIAWGIRLPSGLQEVLIGCALLAVAYLAKSAKDPRSQVAYGVIIGGGAANIVDRLIDGYVTDFFQIGSFPIFNVADSFVTIGVAILFIEVLFKRKNTV